MGFSYKKNDVGQAWMTHKNLSECYLHFDDSACRYRCTVLIAVFRKSKLTFMPHSLAVIVDTLYFVKNLSLEDAKALLMDFLKLCIFLFPEAKTIESPYNGVRDGKRKKKELYSRNLWEATGIGSLRHDKVIVCRLMQGVSAYT